MTTANYTISPEDQRLQYAADKDAGRYQGMRGVHFNERFAVATDGRILACRPKSSDIHHTNVEFKAPKQKTAKSAYSGVKYNQVGSMLVCDDGKNTASMLDSGKGSFPRWEDIVNCNVNASSQTVTIGLDAALLYKLAQAISEDGENTKITLEITSPKEAIQVVNSNGTAFGVIMPVTTDEEERPYKIINRIMGVKDEPEAEATETEPVIESEPIVEPETTIESDPEPITEVEPIDYFASYNATLSAIVVPAVEPVQTESSQNPENVETRERKTFGGVHTRGADTKSIDWDSVAARYLAGEPQKSLATSLGVSHGCVFSRLKKMGISRPEKGL